MTAGYALQIVCVIAGMAAAAFATLKVSLSRFDRETQRQERETASRRALDLHPR